MIKPDLLLKLPLRELQGRGSGIFKSKPCSNSAWIPLFEHGFRCLNVDLTIVRKKNHKHRLFIFMKVFCEEKGLIASFARPAAGRSIQSGAALKEASSMLENR